MTWISVPGPEHTFVLDVVHLESHGNPKSLTIQKPNNSQQEFAKFDRRIEWGGCLGLHCVKCLSAVVHCEDLKVPDSADVCSNAFVPVS